MTGMGKKVDRRVLRSKEALKQALLNLMEQKDFDAISITEIVERANYNRGTFYTHYENKEALLGDIMEDLIQDLLRSFRAPYENQDVFRIDELTANSVQIFEHIYTNEAVYTILLKSKVILGLKERMFQAIKQIAMEELVYEREDSDINPELSAVYAINALLGLIFHWIEGGFKYPPSYMQEQLILIINWHPREAKTNRKR
ncbi:TetR family transcriptional regulator [Paenibacillus cellulosilyticus]|uniref:TetR family transcriptional regulator n=1 Tax=Paenibacillus cellulosilyticus TaxID=375489 RepID=A0A2V2Z490_9BACL|nr:TetR/AcrR family transcriptional regulator [Paenibacillus cellulosilyticus]PWW08630.1 TetR family transcriptional regulator [Paenibacillus cellulosilyticus]QKS48197.1 TetR/AcrR family transcriptional regulator [Paenibacillus cellulosilyticus]